MSEILKNSTCHSNYIIEHILKLGEQGLNSKNISKQSFLLYGYEIQEATITNILKENHIKSDHKSIRNRKHRRIKPPYPKGRFL